MNLEENTEIEEVAGLPLRAQNDDYDLVSVVELTVRCNGLPNFDRLTLTDPICVMYIEDSEGDFREKGRTEVQKNTLDPAFINSFRVTYSFEKQTRFKFDIYDVDYFKDINSLARQTFIGNAFFNIHEIVCAPFHTLTRELKNSKSPESNLGSVTVTSEETSRLTHKVNMVWKVDNSRISGHVFLKLNRCAENIVPVYQTEARATSPCIWEPIKVTSNRLCRGDETRLIRAELYKLDRKKSHKFLGSSEFTLQDLRANSSYSTVLRKNQKKVTKLKLNYFRYIEKVSFLEYVLGGCEISLMIAIDFTKSNGVPQNKNSLHCISFKNEYIQAIKAVGNILQYYDSDKKIPIYGFGAKLPPYYNTVSHCFALNGNIFDPEVHGIEGVLEAYRSAVSSVDFHGPTVFHEIIRNASLYASSSEVSQERQQYFILLILTDGVINDLQRTTDEIVKASELPLSIIIVGVGTEDFSDMKFLDADFNPLYSQKLNKSMSRDIVQFVPFAKFKQDSRELAKEVLFEVPKQLISFMKSKKIKPNKPLNAGDWEPNHPQGIYSSKYITLPMPTHINTGSLMLSNMKKQFILEITNLGYDRDLVTQVVEEGVPCMDLLHAVEIINSRGDGHRKFVFRFARKKYLSAS